MMSRQDRKAFEEMPEALTVYRGYQVGRYRHKSGFSWSLSKETAEWFAYRWPENGKAAVAVGTCLRSNVIAYLNGRQEQTIIIDPQSITGVKVMKEMGSDPFKPRIEQTKIVEEANLGGQFADNCEIIGSTQGSTTAA